MTSADMSHVPSSSAGVRSFTMVMVPLPSALLVAWIGFGSIKAIIKTLLLFFLKFICYNDIIQLIRLEINAGIPPKWQEFALFILSKSEVIAWYIC